MLCAMSTFDSRMPRRRPRLLVAAATFLTAVVLMGSASAVAHPVPTKPIETVTVHGPSGRTYVLKVWARKSSKNCAAQAHGQVKTYLKQHDCAGVTRFLVTTKVGGRAVAFAQASSGFRGKTVGQAYRAAGNFAKLINKDGTGNYNALFTSGYHVPNGPQSIPSPDAFGVLTQDSGATSVDAWWVHGHTPANQKSLERMINDIYLQWS
jgi:hypothetical protein